MQNVSSALKAAFNPANGLGGRYVDYSLEWGVINQDAQDNGSPSAAEDTAISRIGQLLNGTNTPLKIATFEQGGFPLDGTVALPPAPDELPEAEVGLIMPDLSDAYGMYSTPQVLTITLPYKYDWIAFSLNFGSVPSVDFTIAYYEDTTVLHTTTVTGNMASLYVDSQGMADCNKVLISVTRGQPHHRVRIAEVLFGVIRIYTKANSQELQISECTDPLNERVPANELKISVDNFAREYNIFDPAGIYAYLQTRQLLKPRIGAQQADLAMGYVGMGRYYLQAPELKNGFSRLELRATDLLGVLQDTLYTKGVYKTATLAQFVEDVATDARVTVSYPASFSSVTLAAYLPSVSHAEAFRRIAQASNTLLFTSREDVITFAVQSSTPLQTFTRYDYSENGGLVPSDDTIINTVEVERVSIEISAAAGKLAEVTGSGTVSVKYEPSTQHSTTVTGGTLTSATYYADNAILVITGGTAVVSGKKLISNRSTISVTTKQPYESALVYSVKDNPMIQITNAASVAAHYLALKSAKRRIVKMQYRGYPFIEPGDCVDYNTGAQLTQPFIVTRNRLKLSGGMTGSMESREAK